MKIGIPRALAYHRYGVLWESFLQELDIPYITGGETTRKTLEEGSKHAVDESCLPLKLYMGHVSALLGRCDRIFVPRLRDMGRWDEFCVRFWGLPDTVRGTFAGARLLTYELKSKHPLLQEHAFLRMGKLLERGRFAAARAYRYAKMRQMEADFQRFSHERMGLRARGMKILIAANPYLAHDPVLGGRLARLLRDLGAVPIFPNAWNPELCKQQSKQISENLYWGFQRETLGAVHLARGQVDGVILLTAFPCGSDCLANELVLRRVRDVPVTQVILDEHQGEEGLRTRLESFLDMVSGRRRSDV